MTIKLELISGFLIGFEIIPEYKAALIDIGIVRFFIDWDNE